MVQRSPYPGWCLEFLIVSVMPHSHCGDSVGHTTRIPSPWSLTSQWQGVTWWDRRAHTLTPDNLQLTLEVWGGNTLIRIRFVTSQAGPVPVHLSAMLKPAQHPYLPLLLNKKCPGTGKLSKTEILEQVLNHSWCVCTLTGWTFLGATMTRKEREGRCVCVLLAVLSGGLGC